MTTPSDWVIVEVRSETDANQVRRKRSGVVIPLSDGEDSYYSPEQDQDDSVSESTDGASETESESEYEEVQCLGDGSGDFVDAELEYEDEDDYYDEDDDDDDDDEYEGEDEVVEDDEEDGNDDVDDDGEENAYVRGTEEERGCGNGHSVSSDTEWVKTSAAGIKIPLTENIDELSKTKRTAESFVMKQEHREMPDSKSAAKTRILLERQTVRCDTDRLKGEHIIKPIDMETLAQRARQRGEVLLGISDLPMTSSCKSDHAFDGVPKPFLSTLKDQKCPVNDRLVAVCDGITVSRAGVAGDTMEVDKNSCQVDTDGEAPFVSTSPSPECSTRFDFTPGMTRADFTPAARGSINDGAGSQNAERHSGGFSAESGRKNPRAKIDSEVRSAVAPANNQRVTSLDAWLPPNHNALPIKLGQATNNSAPRNAPNDKLHSGKRPAPFRFNSKMPLPEIKHERARCDRKPAIPHQLRSLACYQDGKVDVSILGDQRYLSDSNPINVQITFVHRPPSPRGVMVAKPEALASNSTKVRLADKNERNKSASRSGIHGIDTRLLGSKDSTGAHALKGVLPPIRQKAKPNVSNKHHYDVSDKREDKSPGRIKAYDFHRIPAKNRAPFRRNNVLPPLETRVVNGKPMMVKKIEQSRRNKWKLKKQANTKRRYSPQNFDIVNTRAQWPEFNTYITKEASERHRKRSSDAFVA